MASIIWERDPQEAMNNPYEYNAQKQFHREALSFIGKICDTLTKRNEFTFNDRTLAKATWMLQTDALHSFKDAIELLNLKKHKVVGRLLRDTFETLNLIEYFNSDYASSNENLIKWYNDEPISNKRYRSFVKSIYGEQEHQRQLNNYSALSNFTHRTYKVLLYGYAGRGDSKLFYDEQWSLPGTIAMYYAILGWIGNQIFRNLKMFGVLNVDEIDLYWNESMEEFQIPRGFLSTEDKEFLGIRNDS
jgi:hypothetical protein